MHKPTSRIIRLWAVMDKTGLSKTSIYRLSKDPESGFPPQVRLSKACVGWIEDEVEQWIHSRRSV